MKIHVPNTLSGITSETLGSIFHCVHFVFGQKTPYFFLLHCRGVLLKFCVKSDDSNRDKKVTCINFRLFKVHFSVPLKQCRKDKDNLFTCIKMMRGNFLRIFTSYM